ncbi:hypothetical protein G9A89_008094 [Geosiphon pyriformis]|nr:hypothetical protein G9A89_008094 [Geosiphon pyriformis]
MSISESLFRKSAPNDRAYKAICRANEFYVSKNYRRAIGLLRINFFSNLKDEYSKALRLSQPNMDPKKASDFSALLFGNRSACYFEKKLYQDAEKDAAQMIRMRPEWGKGYYRRAEALIELQQFDEAIEYYQESQRLDSQNPKIPLRIAHSLILKDNHEMGIAICPLVPGRDICLRKTAVSNPVQAKIFKFAIEMKNMIYVIVDLESRKCLVVDACWDVNGILKFIKSKKWKLVGAIVTHYHFDHVGGRPPPPYDQFLIQVPGLATLLKRFSSLKAYVHPLDLPYLLEANPGLANYKNKFVETTGQHIETLGTKVKLRFIHVPGHTEGSQAIMVNECRLLTGDTLMCGCIGRVDLPGGNACEITKTLKERLSQLEDGIIILPGHDYGGEWTTIGMERERQIVGNIVK